MRFFSSLQPYLSGTCGAESLAPDSSITGLQIRASHTINIAETKSLPAADGWDRAVRRKFVIDNTPVLF